VKLIDSDVDLAAMTADNDGYWTAAHHLSRADDHDPAASPLTQPAADSVSIFSVPLSFLYAAIKSFNTVADYCAK